MLSRLLTVVSLLRSLSLGAALTLDEDIIDLIVRAMELSDAVQTQDPNAVAGSNFYLDGDNAALFVKEGDFCFVAFDNSKPTVGDWWQNLDPFESTIVSQSGQSCTARAGYVRAYTNPDYKAVLEQDLRSCLDGCSNCEAVLVGHSSGGAIAAVAAVALDDTMPMLITFGDPGSISGSCSPIYAEKYYRFVNTALDAQGTLDYDPVPSYNWIADQRGKLFIMGNDENNVVNYGDGNGPNIFQFGYQLNAHRSSQYMNRLHSYQGKNGIGADGWDVDFACNVDRECIADCVDQRCRQGFGGGDGVACNDDSDCESGRCEGLSPGECKPQLGSGEWCNEHSDCTSRRCEWTFTCA
jgi:pimeloyl-ACP methyl ester carboxylesterase